MDDQLPRLADALRRRNMIDAEIATIVGRAMTSGHAGEWIAARIFDLELESSAAAKAIDGRFRSGALAGASVNVKWYLKQEGLLDITPDVLPEYYLVLAGPRPSVLTASVRPWCIESVHLFAAAPLVERLRGAGARVGVATSVRQAEWQAAQIYPHANDNLLALSSDQRDTLSLFRASP